LPEGLTAAPEGLAMAPEGLADASVGFTEASEALVVRAMGKDRTKIGPDHATFLANVPIGGLKEEIP
jgi:hypothetical protein